MQAFCIWGPKRGSAGRAWKTGEDVRLKLGQLRLIKKYRCVSSANWPGSVRTLLYVCLSVSMCTRTCGNIAKCVCVCVSSSVPKSDSQNGFAAIQHSRGHAAITQTHANEAMCDGGSQDWSSWCTCYKVEPYLLTTQLFQAVSGRVRLVMAVEKITCCRPCIFAFITHDWFSRSPSYRSKLLSYKCVFAGRFP